MTPTFILRCAFIFVLTAPVYGQSTAKPMELSEFRGRLVEGGYTTYQGLTVELVNSNDSAVPLHAEVSWDGSFRFYNVPQGDYTARIVTTSGDEITSSFVTIGPHAVPFEIRMPESNAQRPVSGTVSLQELSHPVSKQVRKLLASGQKFFHEQRFDDAAARFREAVQDDPKSPETHADLGMALSCLRHWSDAEVEYRAAVALDPPNSILHSNLGATLVNLKQYGEAESEAATALKLDPLNARAHLVIAAALLGEPGHLKDAVVHLASAGKTIPEARTALEKVCSAKRVAGCP